MNKRRKRTVAENARLTVIHGILSGAQAFANQTGSQPVSEAVASLAALEDLTPEQVKETIGLVDGIINLNNRYAKLAKDERQQVADEEGAEHPGEIPESKARSFSGGAFDVALQQTRARLASVYQLLTAPNFPEPVYEMVPVPAATRGVGDTRSAGGTDQGQPPYREQDRRGESGYGSPPRRND